MNLCKNRNVSNTVAAILVLYLFYYSYRYILKYNSENTSPTYSDTPVAISVIKFILLLGLCLVLFFLLISQKIDPMPAIPFLILGLLAFQELYAVLTISSRQSTIAFCCMLPVLIVLAVRVPLDEAPIDKICTIFLHYTIAYELIQILLFLAFGRLPALAYTSELITDVRFGGPWDDPNGFSVLLSFLIPYAYHRYNGAKRILYVLLLVAFLILTWSMTGIASFLLTLLCLGVVSLHLNKTKHISIKKLAAGISMTVLCVLSVILLGYHFRDSISVFLDSKMGSIFGHLQGFQIKLSLGTLLGFTPDAQEAESSIMMLLLRGGIVHLILFYLLGSIAISYAYRRAISTDKSDRRYPLRKAILFHQIAFLLSTVNLPFVYAFSNMGIFMLFLLISIRCEGQTEFASVRCPITRKLKGKL